MKKTKLIISVTLIAMILSLFGGMAFADETSTTQNTTTTVTDPLTAPLPSTDDIKPVDTTIKVTTTEPDEKLTESQDPSVNPVPPVGKGGVNDPLRQTLKDKIANLNKLRLQEKQIRDTLRTQTAANVTLIKSIRNTLTSLAKQSAGNCKDQITALNNQIKTLRNQIKDLTEKLKNQKPASNKDVITSLQNQLKDLNQKLSDARKNKDKASVDSIQAQISSIKDQIEAARKNTGSNTSTNTDIQNQIKDLKAQIQAKLDQIKTLKATNATQGQTIKALRDKISQGFADIKPLWDNEKALFNDIKALNAKKTNEWTEYHKAIAAKDLTAANTHMDNIINYKQQIISKLNDVGALKTQVNQKLTALGATIKL